MPTDQMLVRKLLFVALALVVSALPAAAASAQKVQVIPLSRDGEILISFQLAEALTDEIRTAIHSGLMIKFVYKVDLRRSTSV